MPPQGLTHHHAQTPVNQEANPLENRSDQKVEASAMPPQGLKYFQTPFAFRSGQAQPLYFL